jgi:hypothetical protein
MDIMRMKTLFASNVICYAELAMEAGKIVRIVMQIKTLLNLSNIFIIKHVSNIVL